VTTALAPPRTTARLRSQQALKDAMHFNRMNVPELAAACGRDSYRHTISHLHAGTRSTCSPHLARRIEESLRLYPGALFELRVSSGNVDATAPPTRGRR
jgi:hypothetical protein